MHAGNNLISSLTNLRPASFPREPSTLSPQNARPGARGKRRQGRTDDPLEKITRKLDKWIDKNPVLSGVLTAFLIGLIGFMLWGMFGETLKWAYAQYLASTVDPVLEKYVTPHFVALRDVVREKAPFAEKLMSVFTPRAVNVAGSAGKEL